MLHLWKNFEPMVINNIVKLESVLEYQGMNIERKFMEKFDVSYEDANDIFIEMKKWLWACYHSEIDMSKTILKIDESLLVIDEMWHTFILFTKEYQNFCDKYFSFFIHHYPTTYIEKENFKLYTNEQKDSIRLEQEKQLSYLYDLLGKETIQKWYILYKNKYNKKTLYSLIKF